MARNWPCSPLCALCDQVPETASHLCLQCPYAKEVWMLVVNWTGADAAMQARNEEDIEEWWNRSLAKLNGKQRQSIAAIMMYTTWHIWKERNRGVFDNKSLRPDQVLGLIQDDINTRRQACANPLLGDELHVS